MEIKTKIKQLASQHFKDIVEIRRTIHKNPELAFQEVETQKFIAAKLTDWCIPFQHQKSGTGVIGFIKGGSSSRKVIALRADMDALPIHEKTGCDYASVNKGVMHACGHDIHVASLLGAALILKEIASEMEGSVKLLFQPAEEKLPGGALTMIEQGVLKNPDVQIVLGQHVLPSLETGKVGLCAGLYMASTDEIYLKISGKGGHAALPDQLIDTVLICSQIIVALQQVVSRRARPSVPSVLSFGKVIANGATNIIPDLVEVDGTFRTMDEQWREEALNIIEEIATSTARAMGGSCEVVILRGYPFLINDKDVTGNAKSLACEFMGEQNVVDIEPRMTSEDFAYFSQTCPSLFYRLGCGNVIGTSPGLHTNDFCPDEKSMETGMSLMAWLAFSMACDPS